ncbi:MAG: glucose 1-dehydrogenase [Burkholderiaceae bacterium]
MKRLQDNVAAVTGAGRGMGEAIARRLALDGAAVVVSDIDLDGARRVAAEIRAAGGQAVAVKIDVSIEADAQHLTRTALDNYGQLDILVNNAGIGLNKLFIDTTPADMERLFRVDLLGAFMCAQAAVRAMLPRGYGRIINIASLSGQRGGIGRSAYGTAKAGLELLTKVMSVELASKGITVNNVAPGAIATQISVEMHDQATRDAYHYLIPQRRYGTAEEVASAVAYLASPEAVHVCGHTLNVDGGFQTAGLMYARDGVDVPPTPQA